MAENTVNIKLDDTTKDGLKDRAEKNGRSMCREAEVIIKRAVKK